MRKMQKKQAEDFVEMLEQAHDEIIKSISSQSYSIAIHLLEDCQAGAIELGNMIETLEGEGFVTVHKLEEYCEITYQLHEKLINNESINKDVIEQELNNILGKISQSIKSDIKVRMEVVFLPYKASMWDSLESVWKAADEDPNCDAYVIPIPYYDKNPDGSFKERHYEGKEYPVYVPVTWYEEYDFEKRRPDAIFIHNPYDDWNYVTSVHPMFYSKELKKYTDMLVYIPYFVGINDNVDKHFCCVPGVFNADKVIVESENVRKRYIEELGAHEIKVGKKGLLGNLEEKVLALGSPKFDKVLNEDLLNYDIPEKWKKLLTYKDGRKKKVILYNTSIGGVLKESETMLEKIKLTLSKFKADSTVVLLWRPHPLLETTLRSMRPDLLKVYREIVDNYKREAWGIYDDSSELYRAIRISDAYYGDWSSVVEIYRMNCKPIMIQKCRENNSFNFAIRCFFSYNNRLFGVCWTHNSLYEIIDGNKLELIAEFSNEEINGKNLFVDTVVYNDFIVFIPGTANNISILNMKKMEIHNIELNDDLSEKCGKKTKFSIGHLYEKNVYIYPENYGAILKLECDTWNVEYITTCIPSENYSFKKGIAINGDNVFVPSVYSKLYMNYKLGEDKGYIKHIDLDICGEGIWSLCENEGVLWCIINKTGEIVRIDESIQQVKKVELEDFECGEYPFAMSFIRENYLYLCPIDGNMFVKVNCKTFEFEKADIEICIDRDKKLVYLCKYDKNLVFAMCSKDKYVYDDIDVKYVMLNTETLETYTYNVSMLDYREKHMKYIIKTIEEGKIIVEDKYFDLNEYFKLINSQIKILHMEKNKTSIYERIKEMI